MKYIREEIYDIIPNRYPLMFLDSLEIEENHAVATVKLKHDTWFFACHYPDNPIMPLSLLIECMTQTFSATFLLKTVTPPHDLLVMTWKSRSFPPLMAIYT